MNRILKFYPTLCMCLLATLAGAGAWAQEAGGGILRAEDRGDFYLVGGRKIEFLRATDEIAIQYADGVTPEEGLESLKRATDVGPIVHIAAFKPKNVGIIGYGSKARGSRERLDQSHGRMLLRQQEVESVYPVLVHPASGGRMVATDEMLVCLRPEAKITRFEERLCELPAVLAGKEPARDIDVYLVRLSDPDRTDALSASVEVTGWPGVEWAEPNFITEVRLCFTPNDPYFQYQQSENNTGQNGAIAGADVEAQEAWDITTGDAGVIIAIIDDGVDTGHADLNIEAGGYDFYNDDSDPSPIGNDGHGTACAGIAAAIGNNSLLISGIASNCKILPIKICENEVEIGYPQDWASYEVIGNAIQYAADRADVLSCSQSIAGESSYIDSAIDYAVTSGRGGLGCPTFFAAENFASGWNYQGGRTWPFTSLSAGDYYFAFRYQKDASVAGGDDCVLIDDVCLIEYDPGDQSTYTHLWNEDFEGTFPPAGWSLASSSGSDFWYNAQTGHFTGTGGSYSPHSGPIGDGEWTELRTPLQTLTGNEFPAFSKSVSTEENQDGLYVYVYDASWSYVTSSVLYSGIPDVRTAVQYPASYASSIAVGASTDCDYRADWSCYGPELDFLAPSNDGWNDIVTLDPTGAIGYTDQDYVFFFGGTSAATPLAAGTAALMISNNPSLTAAEIRYLMHRSCDKIGGVAYSGGEQGAGGRNDQYGYGRINARAALLNSAPSAPISLMRNEGGDYNLYGYELPVPGDWTYWDALSRNPTPLSRDLWVIPSGNEPISMTDVYAGSGLAVLKGFEGGDQNLYLYNVPVQGDWSYWDAASRNPSALGRDLWCIPVGNDTAFIADAGGYIASVKNQGGDYNLYLYNCPEPGDWVYWDADWRNPHPLARDLWVIPHGNDAVAMCGLDTTGDGFSDSLLVVRDEAGDYSLYLWNMPANGDWSYWDAVSRNPSPMARDSWVIPKRNDIERVVGVSGGSPPDELGVLENEGGDNNFYLWNAPEPGDYTYWDAHARNPSPLAKDAWVIPGGNNVVDLAAPN